MYWSNYHSHCSFCDGRSTMEEFVHFAIAKGVKKYGFSSHAPLPFDTFWNMKPDDLPEYKAEFYRLKEKYKSEIELYIGLEVDYIHDCFEIASAFYPTDDLDYLIGSIHYLDPLPQGGFFTIDGNFPEFYEGLKTLYDGNINAVVARFFELSRAMIEKGGFQIVGHMDKIALNASKCVDFNIHSRKYFNQISDLLELIKSKEMIVEINSKSLKDKGFTYPDKKFFGMMNEMKIPVTVNSDCHYPTNILDNFPMIFNELKSAGFKTMHQLIAGKWQPVEFDNTGLKI